MREPGPDHPITIAPFAGRVVVRLAGVPVVDTRSALELREASYPLVFYVRREDAAMSLLERSDRRTTCPYKGEASYFDLRVGDDVFPAAVWSYEAPFRAVAAIAGLLAFYPDRVTIEIDGSAA